MGVFSRLGEIINANISSMLEKAENPEKMVRLMIHEMEDTLTQVKSSAAEVIAARIRVERRLKELEQDWNEWEERAVLAVSKGRDDLARPALEQKLTCERKAAAAKEELRETETLVAQYQEDIARLEAQLQRAYRRQRELSARKTRASNRRAVEDKLYRANRADALAKFEAYAERIDRLEAEEELSRGRNKSLEQAFRDLEQAGDVDAELAEIKKRKKSKS